MMRRKHGGGGVALERVRGARARGWWTGARLGWLAGAAVASVVAQEYAARKYYAKTSGPERFVEDDERTAWTPLWHETLVPAEWLALRLSSTYRHHGAPHGDGAPVLLVQGFMTWGAYLLPLRRWLERHGYRAELAGIGWNADCLDVLTDRLVDRLDAVAAATGERVHLVGHSLGGILARAAAARRLDHVASVAVLGAPFRGLRVHPMLRVAAAAVRAGVHAQRSVEPGCLTLACGCESVRALARPLPPALPQLAIVSRHDGFGDWRYCLDPPTTRVVHVTASHVGLVLNAAAYAALAEHLVHRTPRNGS